MYQHVLFIQPSLLVQTEDDDVIKEERESVGDDSDSSSSSINGMMRRGEHRHHHHRQVELGSSGMGEVSEHSGVHVSYLEELHFRERSELARQMAALALASQVERDRVEMGIDMLIQFDFVLYVCMCVCVFFRLLLLLLFYSYFPPPLSTPFIRHIFGRKRTCC
jgi:hypothetical protein